LETSTYASHSNTRKRHPQTSKSKTFGGPSRRGGTKRENHTPRLPPLSLPILPTPPKQKNKKPPEAMEPVNMQVCRIGKGRIMGRKKWKEEMKKRD